MSDHQLPSSTPTSPSQWTETELHQRITLLESVVKERNEQIEKLQRELRVSHSKVRIVDEVQSENKVLRARLTEMMMKATNQKQQQQQGSSTEGSNVEGTTTTTSSSSSATTTTSGATAGGAGAGEKKEESVIEKLRRQLNESHAPSPLTNYSSSSLENPTSTTYEDQGEYHQLPPTEEDEIEQVMNQARDELAVEDKEERLLRERLAKLTAKK